MSVPAIFARLWEANARIEAAWPFPVSPAPEALTELFEYSDLPPEIGALVDLLPEDYRDALGDGDGPDFQDAFSELCALAFRSGVAGWIGQAAVPVFSSTGRSGSASFSWGHYNHCSIFAQTADELLAKAAQWAEQKFAAATANASGVEQ